MTESQNNIICSTCAKIVFISRAPFEVQEIYHIQNNRNELDVMETYIIFLGSQQKMSKNTEYKEHAMHIFFWDDLYGHKIKMLSPNLRIAFKFNTSNIQTE